MDCCEAKEKQKQKKIQFWELLMPLWQACCAMPSLGVVVVVVDGAWVSLYKPLVDGLPEILDHETKEKEENLRTVALSNPVTLVEYKWDHLLWTPLFQKPLRLLRRPHNVAPDVGTVSSNPSNELE